MEIPGMPLDLSRGTKLSLRIGGSFYALSRPSSGSGIVGITGWAATANIGLVMSDIRD